MNGGIQLATLAVVLCLGGCTVVPARDDPWSGPDKVRHFGASALIAAAAAQHEKNQNASDCQAFRFGITVSASAGLAKEVIDEHIRHVGWSWRDLAADGLGVLAGSLIVAPCH